VRLAAGNGGPVWEGVVRPGGGPAEERAGELTGDLTGDLGPGDEAALIVRPESLRLLPDGDRAASEAGVETRSLPGRVIGRRYGGPVTYYQVEVRLRAGATGEAGEGERIELEVLADVLVDRGMAAVGDAVRVAPRPDGPAPAVFPAGSGQSSDPVRTPFPEAP
jgi:hypothetical protein